MSRRHRVLILAVALVGVGLRLGAMLFGSNFDYDSYEVVGELQSDGENVYAWTGRYNYGPAWFLLLGQFWRLSQALVGDAGLFRIQVVLILIAADLVIAYLLLRRLGPVAATLMLLSPVSILITGFHNQFDNIAIAVGFAAILLIGNAKEGAIDGRQMTGIALLGLSIIFKHVLFFLPLWMGLRQRTWRRGIAVVMIPWVLFAVSFLPWIYDGWWGIYDNVIKYRSFSNAPLVDALTLGLLDADALGTVGFVVFIAAILVVGWWVRGQDHVTAFLVMLGAMVIFAPAMANQFLTIPVAAVAAFPSALLGIWTLGGTWHLVGDSDGLGFSGILPPFLDRAEMGTAVHIAPVLVLAAGGWHWFRRLRTQRVAPAPRTVDVAPTDTVRPPPTSLRSATSP